MADSASSKPARRQIGAADGCRPTLGGRYERPPVQIIPSCDLTPTFCNRRYPYMTKSRTTLTSAATYPLTEPTLRDRYPFCASCRRTFAISPPNGRIRQYASLIGPPRSTLVCVDTLRTSDRGILPRRSCAPLPRRRCRVLLTYPEFRGNHRPIHLEGGQHRGLQLQHWIPYAAP
jgi:hypothetical protein